MYWISYWLDNICVLFLYFSRISWTVCFVSFNSIIIVHQMLHYTRWLCLILFECFSHVVKNEKLFLNLADLHRLDIFLYFTISLFIRRKFFMRICYCDKTRDECDVITHIKHISHLLKIFLSFFFCLPFCHALCVHLLPATTLLFPCFYSSFYFIHV